MILRLDGDFTLGNKKRSVTILEKSEKSDESHGLSMPDLGLEPDPLDLPDPKEWLDTNFDKLATKVESDISGVWNALYCTVPPKVEVLSSGWEQISRCVWKNRSPPKFVDDWYRAQFGLSYAKAVELIGL